MKNKKNICIIGAGGLGREVLEILKDINNSSNEIYYNILGYLDDISISGSYINKVKVLGSIDVAKSIHDSLFIIAIGDPSSKFKVIKSLNLNPERFETVISSRAFISNYSQIGFGSIVFPFASISTNVKIDNFVTILASHIGHDCNIGNFSTISGHCSINGNVTIKEGVFIGSNSTVISGVTMNNQSKLGAQSLLIKSTKESCSYFGIPAVKL
jgi:sugar O-acyltransferase (sialic acid O-acetyltransferase NeuD family)